MPDTDPFAWVCYDFTALSGTRINGRVAVRRSTDAIRIVETLNNMHGDRSHWVETANVTYEEFLEQNRP